MKSRKYSNIRFKRLAAVFSVFLLITNSALTATCPATASSTSAIFTQKDSFTGFTETVLDATVVGPSSNNIYYLYQLSSSPNTAVIRKMKPDNTLNWMTALAYLPTVCSLAVSLDEANVYISSNNGPIQVTRLSASDGAVLETITHSAINSGWGDIRTHILSDNSGYVLISNSNSNTIFVCKYLLSGSEQCQEIASVGGFAFGQLKFNDKQYFFVGAGFSSPFNLQLYKVTIGNTAVDWAAQISCSSGTCSCRDSDSILNSDQSILYSIFIFGSTTRLYLNKLNPNNGSVIGTRYRSSISCTTARKTLLNGDYVVISAYCSSSQFVILFNTITSTFNIKRFTGNYLNGCILEPSTGRIVTVGLMSSNGYTTKFTLDLIDVHTDFTSASWTMDVLSAVTDSIVSQSGITLSSPTTKSYTPITISISTVAYVLASSNPSDVYYQTNDQSIQLVENNVYNETPDLPCSSTGSTSITYSMSIYNGQIVPSWVLIDSNTGDLTISALDVSIDSTFNFYINSVISSPAITVKKKITLSVRTCAVQNCIKCTSSSNSICSTCSIGYVQTSGSCRASSNSSSTQASQTNTSDKNAKSISQCIRIGLQIIIEITIMLVTICSLFNISTMISLWTMINQIQLYLLLLITGAFIPEDVKNAITGLSFTLNPFQYLSVSFIDSNSKYIEKFNFTLSNLLFEILGMNSDSTIYNNFYFFTDLTLMMVFHFLLLALQKLSQKYISNENSYKCVKITKYVINRAFTIMTFGYYIRAVLEMSQYLLISSIFEIHEFNVSQTLRRISLIFAFVVLTLCLSLILISVLFVFLTHVSSQQMHTKLGEFFIGLKMQKKYRFYTACLLTRRTIYVALLITFTFVSFKVLLIFLSIFQMCYALFICILRPYEEVKDNMIEIMNEIFFIFLLSFLIFVNTEDEWTSSKIIIYIGVLALNNLIAFFIISSKRKFPKV